MEIIKYNPTINPDSALTRIKGDFTRADFDLIEDYADDLAPTALLSMRDNKVLLNAWGTAFHMFRHFPQTVFLGEKTITDFPQIPEDLVKRGRNYGEWLMDKLGVEQERRDLIGKLTARTAIHTLEYLGRHRLKIDDQMKSELEREFSLPNAPEVNTKWFSMMFNGLQITTVERYIEEKYFDPS